MALPISDFVLVIHVPSNAKENCALQVQIKGGRTDLTHDETRLALATLHSIMTYLAHRMPPARIGEIPLMPSVDE